jgi:hypothetical protein
MENEIVNEIKNETNNEEIKKILEENLRLTQEIHDMTHKIKSYVTFQKIMSVFYLLIIVVPIIISIIYLPPLIKSYLGPYEELLNDSSGLGAFKNILGNTSKTNNLNQ